MVVLNVTGRFRSRTSVMVVSLHYCTTFDLVCVIMVLFVRFQGPLVREFGTRDSYMQYSRDYRQTVYGTYHSGNSFAELFVVHTVPVRS